MSSITLATSNSFDSDDYFSLSEMASTFYDVDRRPFTLAKLKFSQLPQATQDFLSQITERLPTTIAEATELEDYFHQLLIFRREQQKRLELTLEGVHRAIVVDMLALRADPGDEEAHKRLRDVLIPEWRSRLDEFVDEIDGLVWFEMEMRKETPFALVPAQVGKERREDVQRMVSYAVRCLQEVNERVKREMGGDSEVLLHEQEQEQEREQEQEQEVIVDSGHISDASSTSSASEEEEENRDEDLFSENEVVGWSSDSDSQWIDVKSAFTRVGR